MGNSRLFLTIGALIFWIIAGAFLYNKYCCDPSVISSNSNDIKSFVQSKEELKILRESKLFNPSSFELVQPLSQSVTKVIDNHLLVMQNDQEKMLKISGRFGMEEKNNGLFTDLGLARANNMKKLFVQNGIDPSRIVVESIKMNSDNGLENSSLDFAYIDDIDEKSIRDYHEQFKDHSIIINYIPSSLNLSLTQEQRADIFDIIRFSELDNSINIVITGYSDNVGNYAENVQLSKERAEFVMEKMLDNGMQANRIVIRAFGPERPISTNQTKEGKAKNRRVEITFSKKNKN